MFDHPLSPPRPRPPGWECRLAVWKPGADRIFWATPPHQDPRPPTGSDRVGVGSGFKDRGSRVRGLSSPLVGRCLACVAELSFVALTCATAAGAAPLNLLPCHPPTSTMIHTLGIPPHRSSPPPSPFPPFPPNRFAPVPAAPTAQVIRAPFIWKLVTLPGGSPPRVGCPSSTTVTTIYPRRRDFLFPFRLIFWIFFWTC